MKTTEERRKMEKKTGNLLDKTILINVGVELQGGTDRIGMG